MLGQLAGEDEPDTADGLARSKTRCWEGKTYEVWISRDEMVDFLL